MSGDFYGNGAASTAAAAAAAAAAATSSRWLTEEVFKLIDMVQRDEAIYNPRHKYYFCRPYVENFWREVDLKLEKNPGASLAKWTNLRISFRREYTNYLEEKVPPCWSYFDRMFFLHPYLRKKHQQPKSLDSQVQDALAQINSLSSRLQRERVVAAAANAAASMAVNCVRGTHVPNTHTPSALDTYLEYFDEAEQNNSELDEIIEDEHQSRFQHMEAHSLHNDIKSECDDQVDDYEADVVRHDEDEHSAAVLEADVEPEQDIDDSEMRNYMMDSQATSTANEKRFNYQQSAHQPSQHQQQQQQQLQRIQQLQRLHARSCHDDFRAKRPRSQESISSTQQASSSSITMQSRSAVSFVRPTFTKPVDLVSTTTSNNLQLPTSNNNNNNSNSSNNNSASSNNTSANEDEDGNTMSVAATTSGSNLSSAALLHHHHHSTHQHQHTTSLQRHLSSHHHHHRLEIAAVSSGNANTGAGNALGNGTALTGPAAGAATAVVAPAHVELCDCKTDPDAMFLMSLLPDIQKLNGRDRGKIKIAFQNILQDYLYPD